MKSIQVFSVITRSYIILSIGSTTMWRSLKCGRQLSDTFIWKLTKVTSLVRVFLLNYTYYITLDYNGKRYISDANVKYLWERQLD